MSDSPIGSPLPQGQFLPQELPPAPIKKPAADATPEPQQVPAGALDAIQALQHGLKTGDLLPYKLLSHKLDFSKMSDDTQRMLISQALLPGSDVVHLRKLGLPFKQNLLDEALFNSIREARPDKLYRALALGAIGDLTKMSPDFQQKAFKLAMDPCLNAERLRRYGLILSPSVVNTAFFQFVQRGLLHEVRRTLLLGANIEVYDPQGDRALHLAMRAKNLEMTRLLMKFGADPQAQNLAKQSPRTLAMNLPTAERNDFYQLTDRLQKAFVGLQKDLVAAKMASGQLRQLAYISEIELPKITLVAKEGMGKLSKEETGFTHSLLYKIDSASSTTQRREIYVLMQSRGSIRGSGTSKKASEVIQLPLQQNQEAQRMALVLTKKALSSLALDDVQKELELYQKLRRYGWELDTVIAFSHTVAGEQVYRLGMLQPPGVTFIEAELSLQKLVEAATKIALRLAEMHHEGYIHGDLKGENALVGEGIARPTDFGFTFNLKEGMPPVDVISMGYYGSIHCTAPELFGDRQFAGDMKKVEVFAYGDMLYRKLFLKKPPWADLLMSYRQGWEVRIVSEEDKKKFNEILGEHVVKPYERLLKKREREPLSPKEQYELVIYKTLHPDLKVRPTMEEAFHELSRIVV